MVSFLTPKRWKLIRWLLAAGICWYILRAVFGGWSGIEASSARWNAAILVIAFVWLVGLQNLFLIGWTMVLRAMGLSLPPRRAFVIFHQSQLMRFAPGNIWHIVGRTYMASRDGLSAAEVFCSMVVENAVVLVAAVVVFTATLPFGDAKTNSLWYLLLIPPLAILVYPPFLSKTLSAALRLARKTPIEIRMKYTAILKITAYQCIARIAGGIALFLVASSVYSLDVSHVPAVIRAHALAYTVGYISFVTPSGLGVREAALTYLLKSLMPLPLAALTALLARIVWTLSEVTNAGAGVLVGRLDSRESGAVAVGWEASVNES